MSNNIRHVSEKTKEMLNGGEDLIVSVSGGKDSTAVCLRMFELGYTKDDFQRVFFDTGWESQETYRYLDELEDTVGKIQRLKANINIENLPELAKEMIDELESDLGYQSQFVRAVFYNKVFPSKFRKYCTRMLKIQPFNEFTENHDNDIISIIGVRREESKSRANVSEWEWSERGGFYVWRPLYNWTEKDVIEIHSKFNIIPNRMYLNGSNRVGCYPCIYSNKKQIRNIEIERIAFISKFEKMLGEFTIKTSQNESILELMEEDKSKKGFFYRPFFSTDKNIDEIYEWAQTTRGGKQFMLFETDKPSCSKWGLCDFSGSI